MLKNINILILIYFLMNPLNIFSKEIVNEEIATFAGGCFWCMEPPFEKLNGVFSVTSGYTGGKEANPTYEEVSSGKTGHQEAIQIIYDPAKVSYTKLLDTFWRQIDPTDSGGQFADRGTQYSTAIFYHNENQKKLSEISKKDLDNSKIFPKKIITKIVPFLEFYNAEEYHQDYYKKNSMRYQLYRFGSGRNKFLDNIWENRMKKQIILKNKDNLLKNLTPLQFKVTQHNATEKAFDNEYWDNKKEGIYVDIVSGEPLFSSKDKFESHTGWPSFTRPLKTENIIEKEDVGFFMKRIEVRSYHADSHLGHLFDDGPQPGGLRYCINSASLKFIPADELNQNGFEEYTQYFEN